MDSGVADFAVAHECLVSSTIAQYAQRVSRVLRGISTGLTLDQESPGSIPGGATKAGQRLTARRENSRRAVLLLEPSRDRSSIGRARRAPKAGVDDFSRLSRVRGDSHQTV